MISGQRVKWVSHKEKVRFGVYVMDLQTKKGFVLIKGDDGQAHVMKKEKPQAVKKETE